MGLLLSHEEVLGPFQTCSSTATELREHLKIRKVFLQRRLAIIDVLVVRWQMLDMGGLEGV
jgi:hypothetical protein